MPIVRTAQQVTVIDNEVFDDVELGWESIGFLFFLLSEKSNEHELNPYERDTIMPRLKAAGYVTELIPGSYEIYTSKQSVGD